MRNEAYGSVQELDIMSPDDLASQIRFEHSEIAYYENLLSGRGEAGFYQSPMRRRRWWRRRAESIQLLGLIAYDEGIVNQDATV